MNKSNSSQTKTSYKVIKFVLRKRLCTAKYQRIYKTTKPTCKPVAPTDPFIPCNPGLPVIPFYGQNYQEVIYYISKF